MMNLEQAVLRRIMPSEEEEKRLRVAVSSVVGMVTKAIKRLKLRAEPVLVGSVAKGTYLTHPDFDVFVAFPPDTTREALERQGLQLGQFLKNKKKMWAEHPYTRGTHMGFDVEIVPCYAIVSADQKMSAVDRTPFHNKYVLGKIKPEQRDQVRLLKAFMKGIGVYGAESKVQGFSGYLVELLVLKYGSFQDALMAVTNWQAGNVIALDMLPARIFDEPLIIVDPVDPNRNVASAVSRQQMAVFVHAAREYLKKPRIEFFFPKPPTRASRQKVLDMLKTRGTHLMVVTAAVPKVTDDVLYPQIRKALKAFEDLISRHDFSFSRSAFDVVGGRALFMFEMEILELPAAKKHMGPPTWVKNSLDFQEKWQKSKDAFAPPYIEDGFWAVDIKRGQVTAADLVKAKLVEMSLGKDLDKTARKSLQVMVDEAALKPSFLGPILGFMDRRFPWER
jgi:tRNA nucleotidyltransferase (CCA-adding enzyme)